jgi:hypothetical protein
MCLRGNGRITKEMGEEYNNGKTVQYMRDTGRTTLLMDLGDSFMLMGMSMLGSGLTIEHLERGLIIQLVEPNMRANGRRISNMDMDCRRGKTKRPIKGNIKMERNMERVPFYGKTTVVMMASLLRIISTALANISGRMEGLMRENGKITKCREKGCLPGWMVENIRGNTRTIRRKVLAYLHLETVEYIKESGRMVSSMEKEYSAREI